MLFALIIVVYILFFILYVTFFLVKTKTLVEEETNSLVSQNVIKHHSKIVMRVKIKYDNTKNVFIYCKHRPYTKNIASKKNLRYVLSLTIFSNKNLKVACNVSDESILLLQNKK